ncbi:MAG: PDZ domain-containing protein [Planctomycetota bacterium]
MIIRERTFGTRASIHLICAVASLFAVSSLFAEGPARGERDIKVRLKKATEGGIAGQVDGKSVNLGTYHALLIGINKYQHTDFAPELRTAVRDVKTVRRVLSRQYGFEHVRLLCDENATKEGILEALSSYRKLGKNDNLLIYFAGHGHLDKQTDDGFWIPVDGSRRESSWISVAEIQRQVKNLRSQHVLLISDSCFSGSLTRAIVKNYDDRYLREVNRKNSYQVMSSGGLETVSDAGRHGLSPFAYHFVSYLEKLDQPYVITTKLFVDVQPSISRSAEQTPRLARLAFDEQGEFVFANVGRPELWTQEGQPRPPAAWLGVRLKGGKITKLLPGSPLKKAGFRVGDVLLEFDGLPIRAARDVGELLESIYADDVVDIVVRRGGKTYNREKIPLRAKPGFLGLGAKANMGVVTVSKVAPGSPAEAAGIQVGDVVVSVNDRSVGTAKDLGLLIVEETVGSTLRFQLRRGEEGLNVMVTLTATK